MNLLPKEGGRGGEGENGRKFDLLYRMQQPGKREKLSYLYLSCVLDGQTPEIGSDLSDTVGLG